MIIRVTKVGFEKKNSGYGPVDICIYIGGSKNTAVDCVLGLLTYLI